MWDTLGQIFYSYDVNHNEITKVTRISNSLINFDSTYNYYRPIATGTCSALFNLYPDTVVLHHYFVTNLATGTGPLTYVWSWGDGTSDTGAYPSHVYASAGFYNICLTIRDSLGCSSSNCSNFNLQRNNNAIIYIDVLPPVSTGIEKTENKSLLVHPNPTTSLLTIQLQQNPAEQAAFQLFDITGRLVLQKPLTEKTSHIDLTGVSRGMYLYSVSSSKGKAGAGKVVVE